MLISLTIRDVVLIDRLELHFQRGFSVLTGETGAGKSILLDSLGLALGMRGDSSLIRQGAEQAIVTAEFDISLLPSDHPLWSLLRHQGWVADNSILILRRSLYRDNRSKAYINDQSISIRLLRQVGDLLLEIHSQFDHLFDISLHQQILDRFTTHHTPLMTSTLKNVETTYQVWCQAQADLISYQKSYQQGLDQHAFHQQVVMDLAGLRLLPNEEDILLEQRQKVAHYGKISTAVQEALKDLHQPHDLLTQLVTIQKNLERANTLHFPELSEVTQTLDRAVLETQEAYESLKKIQYQDQDSLKNLERLDERLYTLRSFSRRYGVAVNDLLSFCETSQRILQEQEQAADSLAVYQKAVDQAWVDYQEACQILSSLRQQGALQLQQAVMRELASLKLDKALFVVNLQPHGPTATGMDTIEFLIAANPGQIPASLHKVASGGELSRLMLALKVVLTQHGFLSTIVFDEVDSGVGGAIAAAIGQRLAKLSAHVQVLAITHLPQVAAYANRHFCVTKQTYNEHHQTSVHPLTTEEKVDELARMLAGATITPEVRAAAQQLHATCAPKPE